MQKISGNQNYSLLALHETQATSHLGNEIQLQLLDMDSQQVYNKQYDAVILATGYTRTNHKNLLKSIVCYLPVFEVDRYYRLHRSAEFKPGIFLQSAGESTHGLSDTLLSILAVRNQ